MKKFVVFALFAVLLACAAAPAFAAPAPKAGWPSQLKFMSGPPGGNWFALGNAFADLWSREVLQTTSSTGGGVSNIINADVKKGDFGFSVTSLLGAAIKGEQDFLGRPTKNSVVMANLYTQYTYFIMRKDFAKKHNINKLGDVFDKKIPVRMATLKPGTASEFVVKSLFMKGYGITYKDIKKVGGSVEFASYDGGADLLADNLVDMFAFSVGSVVLGVVSVLSFFHWGFLILPLTGVLLGVAGLVNLARVEGARVGVYLSCTGIGLSLLLGVGLYGLSVYRYYHTTPPGYLLVDYNLLESDDPNKPFPDTAYELEGERVFIRGYMYSSRQQTGLRSFVMSRDNGVCAYCLPNPKVTDQVFVELAGDREAAYTTRLIGVGGVFSMKLDDPKRKYGGVVYHIEADYLR